MFRQRWTDEQRDACRRAVLERELSAAETARRAAAGELEPELEPFPIPASTVRDLVATARARTVRDRVRTDGPRARVATIAGELAAELELETARVRRRARRAGTTSTAGDLRELARAGREILALQRTLAERAGGSTPPDPGSSSPDAPAAPPEPGLLERVAATHGAPPA